MMYNGKNLTYDCQNEGVSSSLSKAAVWVMGESCWPLTLAVNCSILEKIELFPGWLNWLKSFRFSFLHFFGISFVSFAGFTGWWMVAISWLPVLMFLVRGSWWWYNGLSNQGQLLRRLSWWRIPRHQNRARSPWREMKIAVQISHDVWGSSSPRELPSSSHDG